MHSCASDAQTAIGQSGYLLPVLGGPAASSQVGCWPGAAVHCNTAIGPESGENRTLGGRDSRVCS
jgi:hypothetical protein